MIRHRSACLLLSIIGLSSLAAFRAEAQYLTNPSPQRPTPTLPSVTPTTQTYTLSSLELSLLKSLQANPSTTAYQFATQRRGSKIALRARVGTKLIHDVAIQTAIALGVPVIDEIVIDTLAAHQAASGPGVGPITGGYGQGQGPLYGYSYGNGYGNGYGAAGPSAGLGGFPGASSFGSQPYTYPPPLFGRLDDPFFGFEPPAIGYPPWWGALTYNRVGPAQAQNANPNPQPMVGSNFNPNTNQNFNQANMAANPPINPDDAQGANIPYGTIDMAIDPRGVATLRGTVPTLAERITLGQKIAQTPGVTQVINLISVNPAAAQKLSDTPPPAPMPADAAPPAEPTPRAPAIVSSPDLAPIPIQPDNDAVGQRASKAIASKTGIVNPSVKVKVRDGIASLTGKVPTVYEAMMAFRAVQRTPGVREVEDRLEFVVPDGTGLNPLAEKGKPEDVEPYLEAQIRRQVGDLAHVDSVRIHGDSLDLKGTLEREEDRPRFDAIIRSMAILRGFKITAEVPAEAH
jgi:hypothetical protein